MTSSLSAFSRRSGKSCFASLVLSFVFSSASALELTGISVEPPETAIGQQVEIAVDFKVPEDKGQGDSVSCGLLINFGDNTSQYIRVEKNNFSLKLSHAYDRMGNFPISAEGKMEFRGFNTVLPCSGSNRATAVYVREEDFAAKEADEQAAKKAAFEKAAAERQAAERAAKRATAERVEAERTAKRATAERSAAERAIQKAVAERSAAEKASADRLAAEKAASANNSNTPSRSSPPEAEAPKKPTTIKARSAMDL